jgi:hypothetical protein
LRNERFDSNERKNPFHHFTSNRLGLAASDQQPDLAENKRPPAPKGQEEGRYELGAGPKITGRSWVGSFIGFEARREKHRGTEG